METRVIRPTWNANVNRRDIFILNINYSLGFDHYNIFIDPDGTYKIDAYWIKNPKLLDKAKLTKYISKLFRENREFVDKQNKWYDDMIWEYLDGKTPEDTVDILDSFGW